MENELAATNARLKRLEQDRGAAQALIPADVQSVCFLHVSVAFRNLQTRPASSLCGAEFPGRAYSG